MNAVGLGELMGKDIKSYGAPRAVWGMACKTGPAEAVGLDCPSGLFVASPRKLGQASRAWAGQLGKVCQGCANTRSTYRS